MLLPVAMKARCALVARKGSTAMTAEGKGSGERLWSNKVARIQGSGSGNINITSSSSHWVVFGVLQMP